MAGFRIFTESIADIVFIRQYIQTSFNVTLSEADFFPLKSWSGYKAGGSVSPDIQLAHDSEMAVILILDADNDFAQRQAEVMGDFQVYNIPVNLFLFPNNNEFGNLEMLLCSIAIKQDILRCFEGYEACITNYELPVTKSKIFAYLDALLPAKHKKNDKLDLIQERNRNYQNLAHWNLHHEYLTPLQNFLQPFLQP